MAKPRLIAQDIRFYELTDFIENPTFQEFGKLKWLVSAEVKFEAARQDALQKGNYAKAERIAELQFSHSLECGSIEIYK